MTKQQARTATPYMEHLRFRMKEYPQIGENVYADWTGAALPPQTLLKAHTKLLSSTLLGNPHSSHTPSAAAKDMADETRKVVLKELGAEKIPGDEYAVVFTHNATAAVLLLNHIQWANGSLLMLSDNHNSVNGLRKTAKREGALTSYSYVRPDLTVDEDDLSMMLEIQRRKGTNVFAYPMKSNYSGIVHGLSYVEKAQKMGWKTLLDVSAYLPNHKLDLKAAGIYPDFIPMSFYKIFGYPSGVGCLVIKRSCFKMLEKKWFSGGSIIFVNVRRDFYIPELKGPALYEDGTIPFLSIPMIQKGFDYINKARDAYPKQAHTLASAFYDGLSGMSTKKRKVVLHAPRDRVSDTVGFHIMEGGTVIDPDLVEKKATEQGIHIRSGCHCNPGCNEAVFKYTTDALEEKIRARQVNPQRWEDVLPLISPTNVGALRASFGVANNMGDVSYMLKFFETFLRQ